MVCKCRGEEQQAHEGIRATKILKKSMMRLRGRDFVVMHGTWGPLLDMSRSCGHVEASSMHLVAMYANCGDALVKVHAKCGALVDMNAIVLLGDVVEMYACFTVRWYS